MKKLHNYILIGLLFVTYITHTKNIIFDLGGIVFTTNKLEACKHLGVKNVAYYLLQLKNPAKIKNIMFETLEKIYPWPENFNKIKPTDDTGKEIPYLMYCWLNGSMNTQEIRDIAIPAIDMHLNWFATKVEQKLVKNIVTMIFTPQQFIKTQKINSDAISFIKMCKKAGHKIYVLSNWDKESFSLLKQKHSDLFSLFNGIVISGNVNKTKPNSEIYNHILKKYNLQASDCYFIDNQQINITAAKQSGINGIVCNANNLFSQKLIYQIKDTVVA